MKRIFLLLVFCCWTSASSLAQAPADLDQGLKPYGAYQHGSIDSVNLADGNVMIHIPLAAYPQRGGKLDLSFSAVSNNKGWYKYTSGGYTHWRYSGGEVAVMPSTGMTFSDTIIKVTDYSGAQYLLHHGVVKTPDGSVHDIGNLGSSGLFSSPGETIDASGVRYASGILTDRHGIQYGASSGYPVTDTNGNQITGTTVAGTAGWMDTLGRIIPGTYLSNTNGTYGSFSQAPGVPASTTNCPSGTASALAWNVPAYNGSTATVTFCFADYNYQTSFNSTGVLETSGTYRLIKAIVLPNLTKWQFTYDAFLDVTSVAFPTGGSITYNYGTSWNHSSRQVTQRIFNANDGTGNHTTNYVWHTTINSVSGLNLATDPAGNDTVLAPTLDSYIGQAQYYSGSYSAGVLLKTVNTSYHWDSDPWNDYTGQWVYANVFPTSQTITWPNGKTATNTTSYDSGFTYYIFDPSTDGSFAYTAFYGQPILQTLSDYGQSAAGPVIKQVSTSYYYGPVNALDLVQTSTVLDGSGNKCAETDYAYDNASYLTASGVTTQHISVSGRRGNVSSITHQLTQTPCSPTATWRGITSYVNAYDTGVSYQTIDPLGHTTTYSYSSTFAGAYPTQVQTNSTTTPGVSGSVQHITSANYDFNTGFKISASDENGNSTSFQYDNSFRLIQSSFPDSGSLHFSYQDSAPFGVTVTRKITSTMNEVTTAKVDGVGRLSQTQFVDPNCTAGSALVKTDFAYTEDTTLHDLLSKSSTPYCDTPNTTYGLMSVSHSDTLNRTKSVVQTDSSTATTTYNANQTTVTDEAGKKRTSQVDGLGRVTTVWEDPSGANWETDYQYDPLGNLLRVDQKGTSPADSTTWRTRLFTYDSLSRMLTSYNPERGTITYTYNDDGTVATRSAPKPNQTNSSVTVTTMNSYDEIHRLTTVSYSDGTTPTVKYTYDGVAPSGCTPPALTATNPKPRRTSMCDAAGTSAWSFDVMGRALAEARTTNGVTKTTSYTYNADGSIATLTYPSGRVITYTYNAAARPISAVDVANSINYATAATYAPQGALASLQNGGSIVSTMYFNSRLQPCRTSVKSGGTAPASCTDTATGNVLDLTYAFNLGSGDNGDVMGVTNNRDTTRSQTYSYDALNRLAVAQTTSTYATSPAHCWGEQFTYDAWANLLSIGGSGSAYTGCTQEALSVAVNGNNQIINTGFVYDATGNTTGDGAYAYVYDGENQLTSAGGVNYTYDGDGRRVQKSNGKLYWYGTGSAPLDESDASGNITDEFVFFADARIARRNVPSGNIYYYFADRLGTARMVTNASGTVLDDSDFYPFGGERAISSSSGNTYKFEGKERDTETGNDDFGARFYASRYGRFLSVDWSAMPAPVPYANLTNPQTLNLFSFVAENPETFADLDGHQLNGPWNHPWQAFGEPVQAYPKNSDLQLPGGSAAFPSGPNEEAVGAIQRATLAAEEAEQAQNAWSLSWQISASASFLGKELQGLADTTIAPVVNAVEHPVDTVEGLANAVAHPVDSAGAIVNGVVDTAKGVAHGDPRAIGRVAGTVIATAAGVKGAQAASEEAQGLRAVANEVRSGPRAGELQHVGIVNSKGNLIHLGREGADWHIGIGRGGGASGAGAAFHIPIPSWLGNLLNN